MAGEFLRSFCTIIWQQKMEVCYGEAESGGSIRISKKTKEEA